MAKKKEIPFGYILNNEVYLKGKTKASDRKIGIVKENEEYAVNYFVQKFKLLTEKVENLEKEVGKNQNKGSFLMKLIHLRDKLPTYDGLGDYAPLYEKLELLENQIKEIIHQNRDKNLEIKKALLLEGEAQKDAEDMKAASLFFKDLKTRWLKTGKAVDEVDHKMEEGFEAILKHFYDRRQKYFEQRAVELEAKGDDFRKIIEKAKAMKESSNIKFAAYQFKRLQAEWKKLGQVPKTETFDPWAEFKGIADEFFARYKQYRTVKSKMRDSGPRGRQPYPGRKPFAPRTGSGPYQQSPRPQDGDIAIPRLSSEKEIIDFKTRLCEKAEELQNMDTRVAVNRSRKLLEAWKASGMVPRLKKRELQERFKNAIDTVFQKRNIIFNAKKLREDLFSLPKGEQIKTHIIALKSMLKDDEAELRNLEQESNDEHSRSSDVYSMDKLLASKLKEAQRKIHVKRKLLHELELSYLASN